MEYDVSMNSSFEKICERDRRSIDNHDVAVVHHLICFVARMLDEHLREVRNLLEELVDRP